MRVARPLPVVITVPALSAGDPDVSVWHDSQGNQVGYSAQVGEWRWLRIAGVGAYRFPVSDGHPLLLETHVVPEAGSSTQTVEDYFLRSVLPIALQSYGFEVLHAAAVELPTGEAIVLCGPPESGKSTLSYALAARGGRQLTDDAAVINVASRRLARLPFSPRLRAGSAEHFRTVDKQHVRVAWDGWDGDVSPKAPIAAVGLLSRVDGATGPRARRLDPASAFRALLQHAYAFSLADTERKREMTANYLRLARELPVLEVIYPDGLWSLDSTVATLEGLPEES